MEMIQSKQEKYHLSHFSYAERVIVSMPFSVAILSVVFIYEYLGTWVRPLVR